MKSFSNKMSELRAQGSRLKARGIFVIIILVFFTSPGHAHITPEDAVSSIESFDSSMSRWDLNEASRYLEEMRSGDMPAPIISLLEARILFNQSSYEQALIRLEGIEDADYLDKTAFEKLLNLVNDTHQATEDFVEFQTPHFSIRLKPGPDEVLVSYLKDALEKGYENIGEDLGFFPENRVVVEVYPNLDDFIRASTLSQRDQETAGAVGICKFNRIMLFSPRLLLRGYRFMDTAVHEYTHYVIYRASENSVPVWLHEGIAKHEEKRWRLERFEGLSPSSSTLLKNALREDRLISLERMHPSLVKLDSREEVQLAFAEVSSMVMFMVEKTGKGVSILRDLLKASAVEKDISPALNRTLNMDSLENLYLRWKEYITSLDLVEIDGIKVDMYEMKGEPGEEGGEEYKTLESLKARNYARLGNMLRRRGYLEEAIVEYKKANLQSPNSALVLNKLGGNLLKVNRPKEALEFLIQCKGLYPDYSTTYYHLGEAYLAMDNLLEAEKNYLEASFINPFHPGVFKRLFEIYEKSGRMEEAERARRHLAKLNIKM